MTAQHDDPHRDDATDEYADVDADTVAEDAIEFFEQEPDASPASDTETEPPG